MVELRPHQLDALEMLSNGQILWGGTGSGKSLTGVAYYMKNEAPRDVYVITTARKRDSVDWEGEFAHFGVGKAKNATVAGVLTVDSWNNIQKYIEIQDAFFIFDEQRLVGSGAWVRAFLKIVKTNRWIMLSATPGDTWMDYIPVFIANGWYKNRTEFKIEHVIYNYYGRFPKIERYVNVNKLTKLRNKVLVEMPFERHTTRIVHEVDVDFDFALQKRILKDRWNIYKDRPLRDAGEMFAALRRLVGTDPSRSKALLEIYKRHSKVIVFYNFDYELDIMRELLKANNVVYSEWNGHKHEEIPETESWVYLVQYSAGSEAWNCVKSDTIIFWSLTYSYKSYQQASGRIDRLNTPYRTLHYYVLKSKSFIDFHIWHKIDSKKSFNESDLNLFV